MPKKLRSLARVDYECAYQDIRITENRNKHPSNLIDYASRDLGRVGKRNTKVLAAAVKSYFTSRE